MILTTLLAEATDKPVWFLFGATVVLAMVTAAVAGAAIYALRQLAEVRVDRDVQVLADFGRRWDEALLTEARELDLEYTRDELMEIPEKLDLHPVAQQLVFRVSAPRPGHEGSPGR